jgi:hypothetical protein
MLWRVTMKVGQETVRIPTWRGATESDVGKINEIADVIHLDLPERPEVFLEKVRLFPKGCYVLESGGNIVGYGLAHPWLLKSIPPLDTFLGSLPASPDCLYIHDVAILPIARGHQSSGTFVTLLAEVARNCGISAMSLVSVYNTFPLWERYGFRIVSTPDIEAKLKSYGSTAQYMENYVTARGDSDAPFEVR